MKAKDWLREHGFDGRPEDFINAVLEMFVLRYPDVTWDDHVCDSIEAIGFAESVRSQLKLVGQTKPTIKGINKIVMNGRKAKKTNKIKLQKDDDDKTDNLPGQIKMPWQPERPPWDKAK